MIYDEEDIEEYIEDFSGKDRSMRSKRRRDDWLAKERKKRVAEENNKGIGPYYDEGKGRVVNSGRGEYSKELKKRSNKRVRNTEVGSDPGDYRKVYDYWWELY